MNNDHFIQYLCYLKHLIATLVFNPYESRKIEFKFGGIIDQFHYKRHVLKCTKCESFSILLFPFSFTPSSGVPFLFLIP